MSGSENVFPASGRSGWLHGIRLTCVHPFIVIMLLAATTKLSASDDGPLDPEQMAAAIRSKPVNYDIELRFILNPPDKTRELKVWVPVPPDDAGQEVQASSFSTFPDDVAPRIAAEPLFGNRFAYFEFANPIGAVIIQHALRITVYELNGNLDPAKIESITRWPTAFAPYLRSETQAVVADERFRKLLTTIVPERTNPLFNLSTVMTFADRNFTYDHEKASLTASSVHAIEQRAGHCSDYHGFCAAMGRVMGQPTRVTYGIAAFPKSSPSHCKLEAYLPPYGWVSFDVSETQKLAAAIRANGDLSNAEQETLVKACHDRLTNGFRENSWFVQTRGTDYDLEPPATQRVAVVRTLYAEADGVALADPDPTRTQQPAVSWLTAHRYSADRPVTNAFTNLDTLRQWAETHTQH